MALAFGRSSVTSSTAPSLRVVITLVMALSSSSSFRLSSHNQRIRDPGILFAND